MTQKNESEFKYSLNREEDFLLSLEFVDVIKKKLNTGFVSSFNSDIEIKLKNYLDNLYIDNLNTEIVFDEISVLDLPDDNIKTVKDLVNFLNHENLQDYYFEKCWDDFGVTKKVPNPHKTGDKIYRQKMEAILTKVKKHKMDLKKKDSRAIQLAKLKMLAKELNVEIVEK